MDQNALTVVAPIKPDQLASLNTLLNEIGQNLRHNSYLDISRLTTTHFMRWVILPATGPGPARLLFESNHDGDAPTYLQAMIAQAGVALDAIYGKCVGYPANGVADAPATLRYLQEHSIPVEAFYIGYRGRSAETVKTALAARDQLARFLDDAQAHHTFDGFSEAQIWEAIKAEAARLGIQPVPPAPAVSRAVFGLAAGGAVIGLAALLTKTRGWLPLLVCSAHLLGFLRWRETQDAKQWVRTERARYLPSYSSHAQAQQLAMHEDVLTQNQLTHVVRVRPGRVSRGTLTAVLRVIHLLAKVFFNQGSLGGIPTIHFARWVLLEDGNLVFFSNYDGSWDNYLGDFVDRAAVGLPGFGATPKTSRPPLSAVGRRAAD